MTELVDVMAALTHPSRLRVIQTLLEDESDQERGCGSFGLPGTRATRTHHFRVLREAGLIEQRDYGNWSGVRLRRTEIERRWPGLRELLSSTNRRADDG